MIDRYRIMQAPQYAAGSLLLLGLFIPLVALVILFATGASSVFSAELQGSVAVEAPFSAIFRLLNLLWTAGWIVQLMGFGMLAHLLLRAGDEVLPIPAFAVLSIAAILGILHGTFHMSVETGAAEEAARAGCLPAAYIPLILRISCAFRVGYVSHLTATTVFGWSALQTGLLSPPFTRSSIGVSLFWLVGYFLGADLPVVLLITPGGMGVALVSSRTAGRKSPLNQGIT